MMSDPFLVVRSACLGLVQLEGRTSLRARIPAALADAEALVDDHLSSCAEQHGAERVPSVVRGDLVAFADPEAALRFAMSVQRGLLELPWPSTLLLRPELADVQPPGEPLLYRGLRSRIALVRGQAWLSGGNVLGPAVHRAARVIGLAYGGQTLLTDEVRRHVDGNGAVLSDLGAHPLVGEVGRHRLHQAIPEPLAARTFPPLRTSAQRGGNVRDDAHFVGRQRDVAALEELADLGVRIVSIEGGPGVGRSHLCRQYARLRQNRHGGAGGVWWAGPPVRDVEGLVRRLASLLGLGLQYAPDARSGVRQIGLALANRGPALIALDLLGPSPAIREALEHWTQLAPEVSFVVATPTRLKAKGEVAYVLGPLDLPSADAAGSPRDADAVRLFAQHAQRVGAALPAPDDPEILEMLAAHEGNPRRIRLLAGLLTRCPLDEVLAVGGSGSLDALLEAAWDALTEAERDLLHACVREGEEAFDVETLCVAGTPTSAPALAVLARRGLLDRVVAGGAPDLVRYTTGAEIRAWVTDLDSEPAITATPADAEAETAPRMSRVQPGDNEPTEETELPVPVGIGDPEPLTGHIDGVSAAWLLGHWRRFVAPVDAAMTSDAVVDLDRAMARWLEYASLQDHIPLFDASAVVTGLLGRADQVHGLAPARLVAMRLSSCELHLRSCEPEAAEAELSRAEAGLEDLDDPEMDEAFAECAALVGQVRGRPALRTSDPEGPVQLASRGLEAMSRGDDDDAIALIGPVAEPSTEPRAATWATALVRLLRRTGQADRGRALAERWRQALEPLGDARAEARIAEAQGWLEYHTGNLEAAERVWHPGLEAARRAGDRWSEALLLGPAGLVALSRGDLDACREHLEGALAIHRAGRDPVREGQVTGMLGILDHVSHQPVTARESYRRAVELIGDRGPHRDGAIFAAFSAALEAELGRLEEAEQRWAEAEAQQATIRDPDVAAAMDQLRLALWWARAQGFEQSGEAGRAAKLHSQAKERIAAALASETPLPGEARIALARMDRLFGLAG